MVMIMKNKNATRCWLFIGYWLSVACFSCSIFRLQGSAVAAESSKNFKSKFLEMTLNIPEEEKDKKAKNELKRIIEQIRSINLELQKSMFEPAIVPDKVSTLEPNEVVLEEKDTEERKKEGIEPCLPRGVISEQTVQLVKKFSKNPGSLQNPFELAETLFLGGHLKEAAIFYQEALKRKSPSDPDSVRDRAWILFQVGNCLRNEDRLAAIKFYEQLITEYPNSIWKEFAETRRTLLNWYLRDEPIKLINERKQ
jgi:tetratricopeptide (TPR) repeat protein